LPVTDVTQILLRIETGEPTAAELLLPLVYEELRQLAAMQLSSNVGGSLNEISLLFPIPARYNRRRVWPASVKIA
jgi:ECF sigma factor